MSILFKTYNGKHQLHLLNEVWVFSDSNEVKELNKMIGPDAQKANIEVIDNKIKLSLNNIIVNCKNLSELKKMFGVFADYKANNQELLEIKKKPAK